MTHIRQQIRDAVVAALSGLPSTQDRVYCMRTYPTDSRKGARLLVYTLRETSEISDMGGSDRGLMRTIELTIEAQASGQDFDDKLDAIAAEVEPVIFANRKFGGLAIDCTLTGSLLELGKGDDDRRSGVLTLNYSVQVDGPEADPTRVS